MLKIFVPMVSIQDLGSEDVQINVFSSFDQEIQIELTINDLEVLHDSMSKYLKLKSEEKYKESDTK